MIKPEDPGYLESLQVDYMGDYPEGFVHAPGESFVNIRHLDGVWWNKAPIPKRWHRCRPQTVGWMNYFDVVERCACGSLRRNHRGPWIMKNDRRKNR